MLYRIEKVQIPLDSEALCVAQPHPDHNLAQIGPDGKGFKSCGLYGCFGPKWQVSRLQVGVRRGFTRPTDLFQESEMCLEIGFNFVQFRLVSETNQRFAFYLRLIKGQAFFRNNFLMQTFFFFLICMFDTSNKKYFTVSSLSTLI